MLPAFGLYSHIQANRRRSALLLAGLFFLVYVVAYAGALAARALTPEDHEVADLEALLLGAWHDMIWVAPLATVAALAWIAFAWFAHQKMIDLVTGARPIERGDDKRLYDLLETLCISRGMTMPRLKIMDTDALNAFASGLNERQYAVTVTRGLRDGLTDAELEAVLAHELTHIRNEDVRLMVIAVIIAGIVSFVGELLFRSMRFGPRMTRGPRLGRGSGGGGRRGGGGGAAILVAVLIAVLIVLVAWLLSVVIRFALSRSREFLADAGAAELTKNPDAMISALVKISGRSEMPAVPSSIMEMCIDYPRRGFADIFATHPPIEQRIEALVRHAGGRRPPPEPSPRPQDAPEPLPPSGPWG